MYNIVWGLILVAIGIMLLLHNLDIADIGDTIRTYWPLILVLWGISILTRRRSSTETSSEQFAGELIHESTVFGDTNICVSSQNFKGGSVSTLFGDAFLDLSKTVLADGEHLIRMHNVFGDTIIILPKDISVSVSASSFFGTLTVLGKKKSGISADLRVTTENYSTSTKQLKITVNKFFGDLRVI